MSVLTRLWSIVHLHALYLVCARSRIPLLLPVLFPCVLWLYCMYIVLDFRVSKNKFPVVLEVSVRYTCETTIRTVAYEPISDYRLHTLPPNRPELYPIPTSSSTSSPLGRHPILALDLSAPSSILVPEHCSVRLLTTRVSGTLFFAVRQAFMSPQLQLRPCAYLTCPLQA